MTRDRSETKSVVAVTVCVSYFCLMARVAYRFVLRGDQNGATALLLACGNGHLDVVTWLVTNAGSDARSERTNVSCRCLCVCSCGLSL